MQDDKKETFFPGVKKPVFVVTVKPLANAAGEKRIKVDLSIDLSDNQLLGIPEWLEDAITLVRKANGGSKKDESEVELDGCMLRFYPHAQAEAPSVEVTGVLLKKFVVTRTSKESAAGELADSALTFCAYCYWSQQLWNDLGSMFDRTVYVSFGTLQAKLFVGPPKKDGVPKAAASSPLFDGKAAAAGDLGVEDDEIEQVIDETDPVQVFTTQEGETDEDARARATDPKHDALFAGPQLVTSASGDGKPPKGTTRRSASKRSASSKGTGKAGSRVN